MRRVLIVVLLVVAFLVAVGVLAYRDAAAAQSLANRATREARQAMGALLKGDFPEAQSLLEEAVDHLTLAERELDEIWLMPLRVLPVTGSELEAVRAGLVAARESALATLAVTEFFVGDHPPIFSEGVVEAEALGLLGAQLEEAHQHAATARATLESAPEARTTMVRNRLEEVDEASDLLVRAIEAAIPLAERLETAAAGGEPYRLLVLAENEAELRATGGLMGFLALAEVSNGIFNLVRVDGLTEVLTRKREGDYIAVEAPADYVARYGQYKANTTLWLNVNLSAHFPSVAEVARRLYSEATGIEADGVARIDLTAIGYLLDSYRSISFQGEPVEGSELATDFLLDSYLQYPNTRQHNQYVRDLFNELLPQLISGGGANGRRFVAALRRSIEERRLAIVIGDPTTDEFLSEVGISGRLAPGERGQVQVAVQNFAANKIDLFSQQNITVQLVPQGCAVRGQIDITLINAAPLSAMDLPHGRWGIEGRWWVNVYLPRDAALWSLLVEGRPAEGVLETEQGRPVVASLVSAPAGKTVTMTVGWEELIAGPSYVLEMMPQPLITPAMLRVGDDEPQPFTTTAVFGIETECGEEAVAGAGEATFPMSLNHSTR